MCTFPNLFTTAIAFQLLQKGTMTVEEKEMQPPNGTKPFEKNGGVDNKGMDISDEGTSTSGDSIREAYVKIKVTKPQMNQPEYDHFYGHSDRPKRSVRDVFRDCKSSCECSGRCIGRTILGYLPFLKIMRTYQKDWISLDLIAGITIGIMQIPQGKKNHGADKVTMLTHTYPHTPEEDLSGHLQSPG